MNYAANYSRALRYGGSHGHADFHAKLHENSDEKTTALVYADWLDENGQPHAAALIRRHCNEHDFGVHDANYGNNSNRTPGQFRGVLFDYSPAASVVLNQRSTVNPERTFQWLSEFKPEELPEARRLLAGITADGGDLNGAGKDLADGNHRGLKAQEKQ